MASLTSNNVESVHNRITENIVSNSTCFICGRKMDVSIFIDLNVDCPLQLSWVCRFCSQSGQSVVQLEQNLAVTGASQSEKMSSIFQIVHALADYTQSCSANRLNSLQDLLRIVSTAGIRLNYLDLSATPTVRGMYFNHDGAPYIVLDKALKMNPTEHMAVLAEEVGRHFAYKSTLRNEAEAREDVVALRWAVKFLSSISAAERHDRVS